MRRPYMNVGPGDTIREEMTVHQWTIHDLAIVMEVSSETIQRLLSHQQPITEDIAKRLSTVFGQSVQFWLNQEKLYREYR